MPAADTQRGSSASILTETVKPVERTPAWMTDRHHNDFVRAAYEGNDVGKPGQEASPDLMRATVAFGTRMHQRTFGNATVCIFEGHQKFVAETMSLIVVAGSRQGGFQLRRRQNAKSHELRRPLRWLARCWRMRASAVSKSAA